MELSEMTGSFNSVQIANSLRGGSEVENTLSVSTVTFNSSL
jgi:hypothetical protein